MYRFLVEMADSSANVVTAAAYTKAYGYVHFIDELGDTFYSVDTRSVRNVERLDVPGQIEAQGSGPAAGEEAGQPHRSRGTELASDMSVAGTPAGPLTSPWPGTTISLRWTDGNGESQFRILPGAPGL